MYYEMSLMTRDVFVKKKNIYIYGPYLSIELSYTDTEADNILSQQQQYAPLKLSYYCIKFAPLRGLLTFWHRSFTFKF